jgi:hypothetical protein
LGVAGDIWRRSKNVVDDDDDDATSFDEKLL